jgi:hypothetical protein
VGRQISTIEKQIVDAAEAMPEGKFNFSPGSLNISRGQLHRMNGIVPPASAP